MLPKFRPAALGRDAQARPSIRPVKPGPPPPPPSPPRRMSSGFGPRSNVAAFAQTALDNGDAYDANDQLEASTLAGNPEASTLNRGPETVPLEQPRNPRRGRVDAREVTFEDETQARRVDDRLLDKLRHEDAAAANTQTAKPDLGVHYESLPSLEVRRPFDTYEAAFSERDPVTQLHAARESARVRRAEASYREPAVAFEEPAYNDEPRTPTYEDRASSYRDDEREPSYREPSYPASSHHVGDEHEQDVWGRREESGPRERPLPPPPARSYAAPVPSYDDASDSAQWGRDRAQPPSYRAQRQHQEQATPQGWSSMPPRASEPDDSRADQPMIPPAPRVPEEMHPAFAMGVQRIRTATPDAWGTPHVAPPAGQYLPSPMQAMFPGGHHDARQSSMPPQYAPQQYPAYAYQHAYVQQQQAQIQQAAYAAPQQYLQPGQRQQTPMPMQMQVPMQPALRAQPVGGQLATQPPPGAAANAKIGRFVWFVAGAAFGITFAFFATGVFNGDARSKAQRDEVASAPVGVATVAAATAAAPTAPPVAGAPAPVTQIAAPFTPATLPAVPAVAPVGVAPPAAAPGAVAPPPAVRAPAPAPPPRAPRFQAPPPRRPAPPVSQGPKNLGGGGAGADDDRPSAPPAPPPGADLGDLLGAGLKP